MKAMATEIKNSADLRTVKTERGPLPGDEHTLIDQARKGDKEAFEVLVRKYSKYVFNLAYYLCGGNESEADDLAQMTFIRAYRAIANFEGRSELKTWLHRITTNLWKNMVRGQKRRKYFFHTSIHADPVKKEDERPMELVAKDPSPLENVERNEISGLVRSFIKRLPEDEREVIVLRDIEGYAYEEIAVLSKIPLGTVKSRLSRARQMLKEALKPVLRR